MKKVVLFFIFFALSIFVVNAKSNIDLEIIDAKIIDKEGAIEVVDPVFSSNEINSNITFKELNDSVTYEIIVKNNDKEDYKIYKIEDNNSNENVELTYEYEKEEIKPNETASFKIKVSYTKLLKNVDKAELKDFNIILNVEDESGNSGTVVFNPDTGDNIFIYVIAFVLSLIGLILILAFKKKIGRVLLVIGFACIPFCMFALNIIKINISFKNIEIEGTFDVFTIEIDSGDGSDTITKTITYGDKIGELPTPDKEGYDFTGWVDDDGNKVDENTVITDEINLTATYDVINYTITYNLNGGSANNNDKYNIESGVNINNPTKDYYEFIGWTGSNGNTPEKDLVIPTGTTGDKTYTANYEPITYTITYNLSGGSATNVTEYTVEDEITIKNPTKEKYTFIGWTGSNGEIPQKDLVIPEGSHGDKTYIAHYESTKYTITYNLNGGNATNVTEYTVEDEVTINNPTKEYYEFVGWTGSNGSTPEKDLVLPQGTSGDKTYTAVFEPITYTITYNLGGGSATNATTYTIEDKVTIKNPTKENYTFLGWTGSNGELPQKDLVIPEGTHGNLNYIAHYEATSYTITYVLNGGTATNATTYTVEDEVTITNPTKDYYTFTGWTGSNGTTPQKDIVLPVGSSGNKTYTANYEAIEYTITYNLNGGSATNTTTYTVEDEVTINNPTKENYTFLGWTGSNGNIPEKDLVIPEGTHGDLNYVAHYEVITYTITYVLNGGTATNVTEYTVEDEVTINNPAKDYYEFVGWTGSNGNTPEKDLVIPEGSSGNKTYTANYEAISYTITYNLGGGNATNVTTYTVEDEVTIANPTKDNYTFLGWTGSNGELPQKDLVIPEGSHGDKNYVAHYEATEYTITYNLNGGTATNATTYTVEDEVTISNPSKDYYTFLGWTGSNGTTPQKDIVLPVGSSGNKTYTANYEPITYTITYNLNGGSATNETEYTVEDEVTLNNPTKDYYTFLGWTGSNGTTPQKDLVIPEGTHGNLSYTANYEATTYTITYNLNGGVATNETEYTVENEITLNNPTKDYHEFIGWTGSNGNTPQKDLVIPEGTHGNLSYTANYEKYKYTIKYDANGGSGSISDDEIEYGETTNAANNTFTRTNYSFIGWNTKADGSGTSYSEGDEITFTSTTNGDILTIYALWKENKTLTINAGYGINAISADGWTNSSANVISKRIPDQTDVDLDDITITYKEGYEGTSYVLAIGNGTLDSNIYTMNTNDATIIVSATGLEKPNTPTISGGETKVYNTGDTTLSCQTTSNYDTDVTLQYSFGVAKDEFVSPGIENANLLDEITIGTEKFYVLDLDNDTDNITVFAKYPISESLNQSPTNQHQVRYSSTNYWASQIGTTYPGSYSSTPKPYIFDSNSDIYPYVQNYAQKIKNIVNVNVEGRLLSYEEATSLPASIAKIPDATDQTITYWLGSTNGNSSPYVYKNDGTIGTNFFQSLSRIRPVLKFSIIRYAQPTDEPSSWTSYSTNNTHTVESNYKGSQYYSCRVYATDDTSTSEVSKSSLNSSAAVSYVNSRINLDAVDGTIGSINKIYVEYGSSNIYSSRIKNSTLDSIPEPVYEGYDFKGWYTSSTGGTLVIDKELNITPGVEGWTDENGKWITTNVEDSNNNGNVLYAQYKEEEKTLYNVFKKAAKNGYAREYLNEHQDSMDVSKSTEKIYYWYAANNSTAEQILEKNNLVFGNQCWQMIRTTDTGGVKLLFNGVPTITGSGENISYDCGTSRTAYMGSIKSTQTLTGNYYYGTGFTTTTSGSNTTFKLTNPTQVNITTATGPTEIPLIAENYPYTCKSTNATSSCTTLYKVISHSSGVVANVYTSVPYRDAIGVSAFNTPGSSVTEAGYMYNTKYPVSTRIISSDVSPLSATTLNSGTLNTYGNYYFADDYSMSGNNHVLTDAVKGNTIENYPESWVGKYMCQSSTSSSCATAYYVSGVDTSGTNPIIYRATLSSGKKHDDTIYKYLFGDSIRDNGDGTFEIYGNIEEVLQKDWNNVYSNKVGKYVCMPNYYSYDSTNDKYICSDNGSQNVAALKYVTATTISSFKSTVIYKYGFGVTLNNGKYELVGNNSDQSSLQYIKNWPDSNVTNCFDDQGTLISNCGYRSLNKSHYTCLNLTGVCTNYHYINATNATQAFTTSLNNGKYINGDLTDTNNVLYEMLNSNSNNSTIKINVENWYHETLLEDFDDYIDDTIYCNNRAVTNVGGFNHNGGATSVSNFQLTFANSSTSSAVSLSCPNEKDRFSLSNNLATLKYKVGLLTITESNILGNINLRKAANSYFTMTPAQFSTNYAQIQAVSTNGSFIATNVSSTSYSIRPAISLIAGMKYKSGNGSPSNPYIADYE